MKLISLNIEGDQHLDKNIPFLETSKPDIICLQEVYRHSLPQFRQELDMSSSFVPVCHDRDNQKQYVGLKGLAILTKLEVIASAKVCYAGSKKVPYHTLRTCGPEVINRCLISAQLKKGEQIFQVATTHFTWAANGGTNATQRRDLKKLKKELDKLGEFILCGDFNNPRGEEVYDQLAAWYQDEIPASATTTIDGDLHRAGNLQYVIDGLFTTEKYQAQNVRLKSGVSDHKAVVAEISANF